MYTAQFILLIYYDLHVVIVLYRLNYVFFYPKLFETEK